MKKIAVISTGNGGQSLAGYLAYKGYETALYAREQERVDMFPPDNIFELGGIVSGKVRISLISCDMEEVIRDADLIMVTTPAQYHAATAGQMAPYLTSGQKVILNPGRTFGTCDFIDSLRKNGCRADIILGETDTFIFTCRSEKPGFPVIYEIKNDIKIAGHNIDDTSVLCASMSEIFDNIEEAESVLHTGLSNIGMLFHPLPILMNITRIEAKEAFLYYLDGISPLVAGILEAMDEERLAVADALGIELISAKDWVKEKYGSKGDSLYERIQNTHAYRNVLAPTDIDTRYIFEDIQTGCVPVSCLGKYLGVKTDIIDSVITWASVVYGRDFRSTGRNERLDMEKILSPLYDAGIIKDDDESEVG